MYEASLIFKDTVGQHDVHKANLLYDGLICGKNHVKILNGPLQFDLATEPKLSFLEIMFVLN